MAVPPSSAVNNIVGALGYRVVPCALVLEDEPVGADSRLQFESFPDQFEEAYALSAYREMSGDRMPQPGNVAYRGGNWSAFSLDLKFRAENLSNTFNLVDQLSSNILEEILIAMERKVRWCQALAFPLERTARDVIDRVTKIQTQLASGGSRADLFPSINLAQFTRNDPPMVLVVLGSFLVLRCYLTNYSLRWEPPFHPVTAQPYGCTVTLTFQRLEKGYPTWKEIRDSAGQAQSSPLVRNIQGNVALRVAAGLAADTARAAANAAARSSIGNSSSSLSVAGNG